MKLINTRRIFMPLPLTLLLPLLLVIHSAFATSVALPPQKNLRPTPPPVTWQPPRLSLPPQQRASQPIQLQNLHLSSEIAGSFASTEIDMTFFNPNSQVLEGELQFPLLDGQSIVSFAMDVNGKLRDAVPVEKARGQAVFEEVIRGRIDPGLLEVTQGNNFKLRVYPIPGNGTKRVVLRINETLTSTNNQLLYRLPVGFADQERSRIGRLEIDVRVVGADAVPTLGRNPLSAKLEFSRELLRRDTTYRLHESFSDVRVDSSALEINLLRSAGSVVQTEIFEGKTYFVADVVTPTRAVSEKASTRTIPNVVGLIWDSSRSASGNDHNREFTLLDRYFQKMRDGEVRLTRIRDQAEKTETFRIRNGDWASLRAALSGTAYDGATNLGSFGSEKNVGEYLLFSDGLSNFGERPFAQISVPLYAISASLKTDPIFLRYVAERSGGRYLDLAAITAESAAQTLLTNQARVTSIDASGATELVMATPFVGNGRAEVAGVLSETSSTLNLTVRYPDGSTETIHATINRDQNTSTVAASRWATMKLATLDGEYNLNRAEIRRLGQRFRLVTRETSLIVLDRIEDYVRYEIEPPVELRAEYGRLINSRLAQQRQDKSAHLEQIYRAFLSKIDWWQHEFPKGDKYRESFDKKALRERDGETAGLARQEAPAGQLRTEAARSRAPADALSNASPPPAAPSVNRVEVTGSSSRREDMEGSRELAAKKSAQPTSTSATIRLQRWQPDAPYMARMREASKEDLYRVYLDEAAGQTSSTAFFLDAADVFFERGMNELGVRVLSNLAEMDLENRHILRVLGYRLLQAKFPTLAIPVLKKVLALSPDEPQSYRDLGLAYAANKEPQRAIDSLYEVVIRPWHNRFPEIELITLADMNAIIATSKSKLDTSRIDPRFIKNLSLDLRVVLTWDADNTDIDLWVTDPNGEKAFYGFQRTYQGGRMSQDFTGGYGPEEFSLKNAKPGKYRVEANYFGDRQQNIAGVTTIQVRFTTGFGTRNADEQIVTMRLKDRRQTVFVGEFEVKGR